MTGASRPILVFRVAGRQFGLEVTEIEAVAGMVAVTPLPNGPYAVSGLIDVAGEVVPVFSVRRRLGLAERKADPSDFLILARAGGKKVAVEAEEIVDVLEAADGWVTAEEIAGRPEAIRGAVKTDEGLILIHDLNTFLSPDEERALAEALNGDEEE